VFRDNIVRHNRYGVHGQSQAVGQDTLDAYFPGAVFSSNAIGGGDRDEYPDDNVFLADDELTRQFVDPSRHDYRLRAGSRLARAASDRTNLGADVVKLLQLLGKRIGSSAVDAAR
jgi:hypothetical protein